VTGIRRALRRPAEAIASRLPLRVPAGAHHNLQSMRGLSRAGWLSSPPALA
jgi:hypothetical protein